MSLIREGDFGGGIFRALRGPRGSVYDAVDVLVDDDGASLFKRGGTKYKSNADVTSPLAGVSHARLGVGPRTMFWSSAAFHYLNPADGATPVAATGLQLPKPYRRMVESGGWAAYVSGTPTETVQIWGGSLAALYNAGTAAVTNGSSTVVGAGTAWVANAERGMLLVANNGIGVVDRVTDNTHLELVSPWADVTAAAGIYNLVKQQAVQVGHGSYGAIQQEELYLAVVADRLVKAIGSRLYFAEPGNALSQFILNYHETPGTSLGVEAIRDNAVWFTDRGVWVVGNMNLDLVDSTGAVQQTLQQLNKDIILWDEAGLVGLSTYAGLVGWKGELIVPARDDIYIMGIDGPPVPISQGIRSLYRSYVDAGYKLGIAMLYQGHYFLPVRNGDTIVDTLVCRVDQRDSGGRVRAAWTRMGSGMRCAGYAIRTSDSGGLPVAVKGARVLDLSSVRTPTAATKLDADGTGFNFDVTLTDLEAGQKATLQRVRVTADIVDAAADNPTLAASYGVDADEGAALTALADVMAETTTVPKVWQIVKRGRRFRLRLLSSGPSSKLRLRAVEWFVRDSNRP